MKVENDPQVLWRDVLKARSEVAAGRRTPTPNQPAMARARADLLAALEAYAENLERRGHPQPYQLRHEIRLARLMSGR